jgi:hypothetical protein
MLKSQRLILLNINTWDFNKMSVSSLNLQAPDRRIYQFDGVQEVDKVENILVIAATNTTMLHYNLVTTMQEDSKIADPGNFKPTQYNLSSSQKDTIKRHFGNQRYIIESNDAVIRARLAASSSGDKSVYLEFTNQMDLVGLARKYRHAAEFAEPNDRLFGNYTKNDWLRFMSAIHENDRRQDDPTHRGGSRDTPQLTREKLYFRNSIIDSLNR